MRRTAIHMLPIRRVGLDCEGLEHLVVSGDRG
jgi:hypothetical protein